MPRARALPDRASLSRGARLQRRDLWEVLPGQTQEAGDDILDPRKDFGRSSKAIAGAPGFASL